MVAIDQEVLLPLARRYIWWKSPGEAVQQPRRMIAQVMKLGDRHDVRAMQAQLGDAVVRESSRTPRLASSTRVVGVLALPLRDGRREHTAAAAGPTFRMTGGFETRRDVVPPAQRLLWPQLAPAARLGFVLYGGTAIALRLGQRASVDLKRRGASRRAKIPRATHSPPTRARSRTAGPDCVGRARPARSPWRTESALRVV